MVWNTPDLLRSISQYATSRPNHDVGVVSQSATQPDAPSSNLLMRICAAASYYTHEEGLMEEVPPVNVDITLDPFLFHVLPTTLLPVVAYILFLIPISWYVGRRVTTWLESLAEKAAQERPSKSKRS